MNFLVKKLHPIAAILAALILLQTLYFKFSAAPESVYIFKQLGMEPYGRIGIGITELIAGILLILPLYRIFGALLGIGLMCGALGAHLTRLGIVVMNDGGYLFFLSLLVLLCCVFCLYVERMKIKRLLEHVFRTH